MKGQFLYLVINLFALFSVSYQISALSVEVEGTNLYKMDEQIIKITFDSAISVSKVNAVMTRDSITSITGDCTEIKTEPKIANCSFDLTSVTANQNYNLKIKYDNVDLSTSGSFYVNEVFACYPFVNYLEKEKDQNTIILCNKEVPLSSTVQFKNSTTTIQGVCTKYKEDARKLNCTFDCSQVSGGYQYQLKVTDQDGTINVNKNNELTIGKSNAFRLKITSQLLIILLVILF